MSNIAVPDYAIGGESLDGYPAEAAGERAWALNLLWDIFSPGTHAAPRPWIGRMFLETRTYRILTSIFHTLTAYCMVGI